MRNFLVMTILLLSSVQIFAKKKDKLIQPTISFVIQSVILTSDNCSVAVKSGDGVVYYTEGTTYACEGMRTGNALVGYVEDSWSHISFSPRVFTIYFDAGLSKKGKQQWSPPFTVTSQSK